MEFFMAEKGYMYDRICKECESWRNLADWCTMSGSDWVRFFPSLRRDTFDQVPRRAERPGLFGRV